MVNLSLIGRQIQSLYNTENKQFASAVNGQLLHFSFNSLSLQRLILIALAIYYGFIASI